MTGSAVEIVGREPELAGLGSFLDGGLAAAFVLQGEAGIGKTTLWRAGVADARSRGYRVLACRPAGSETQLSFAALGDLVDDALDDLLAALPPPQQHALNVALLRESPLGRAPARRAIAVAFLNGIRALAQEQLVLIAVDDVQWLDPASASVLEFAARRLDDAPVAILAAQRIEGADADVPLLLAEALPTRVERLGPLSLGALHRIVRMRLGRALPRPALRRIHEASAGNPFYAVQLAELVARRGDTAGPELPLPAGLAEILSERLAEIPDATRAALLHVAALAGPTLDVLERALGTQARSILQPAIDAHLVEVEGGRVAFPHPLLGQAVYGEAWPSARRECHARLADAVADDEERARHLALAAEGPDAELARTLDEAAHRARLRGAPETAASFAEQAWRVTPPEDADARWHRGLAAAEYHMQSGDADRCRAHIQSLLPHARTGDERSLVFNLLSSIKPDFTEALPLAERALAEAETTAQKQTVESDLVSMLALSGDAEGAARHAHEALRLAEQLDDAERIADALSSVARMEQLLGRGLRRDLLERADGLAAGRTTDRFEETVNVVRNLYNWASVLSTADEFDDARRRMESVQRLVETQGLANHLPEVLRVRADLECWAGNWDVAERCVQRCEEAADQAGLPAKLEDISYAKAFLAAHRGRLDDAREIVAGGEPTLRQRTLLRHLAVRGFVELSAGDAASAHEHLARARELAVAAGFHEPNWVRFHGDLAEALVALGRLDEARELVEWLERCGATTRYPWTVGAAARARGLLQADPDAFDVALAAHERLGNPFERARTLLAAAQVQRRAKRRRVAREALEEARALFEQLGAEVWADRARTELSRIGGRAPSRYELTPAEERVAALVASGLTNREAAAELFVTVHTVEAALGRVYAKLGVRSRSELAHRLAAKT